MVLAIIAFTAGRIVLTPTSHGNSKQSPDYWVICGEIYLNLTIVIHFMTRVMAGQPQEKHPILQPISHSFPRHDTAKGRGKNGQRPNTTK